MLTIKTQERLERELSCELKLESDAPNLAEIDVSFHTAVQAIQFVSRFFGHEFDYIEESLEYMCGDVTTIYLPENIKNRLIKIINTPTLLRSIVKNS